MSPSGPIRYETSACPIPDEAFCATATEVIDALQAADVDGDRFNEEAGITDLEWTTHIWHRKGNA